MREDTLKCLVHVIDKLDEKHLQEKLVRCIVNLQGDNEASIRTNATIFLGRIAGKLKDGVRLRVLGQAYLKALRDPFVHCRIAGLKATVACLAYVDHSQLTSKILPQACVLLLDRSQEVRELSLSLLDQSLVLMRSHHAVLCAAEKKAAEGGSANGNGVGPSSSSSGGGGNSNGTNDEAAGWGSWGSSLSKTLEKATGSMTSLASGAPAAVPPQTVATQQQQQSTSSTKHVDCSESSSLPQPAKTSSDSLPKVKDGWGDDWGDNDVDLDGGGDDDDDGSNVRNKNATSKSGWGDDDDLDLDDDGGGKASAAAAPVVPKGLAPSAAFKKKMEEKKPPAKKLDMDANDNWDDF
jgi:SCY1-like protein 1